MKSIYITGANGLLGSNLVQYLSKYRLRLSVRSSKNIFNNFNYDIIPDEKINDLNKKILSFKPDIIINTVGLANVENCERYPNKAINSNINYALNLAKLTKKLNCKFIHISTDHLFDDKKKIYSEDDIPNPMNFYAKSKLEAEKRILKVNKNSIILRTNFFDWGPIENPSFLDKIYNKLVINKKIKLFSDVYFNPLSIKELSNVIEHFFNSKFSGIFNVTSNENISKYDFGIKIAKIFNFKKSLIEPLKKNDIKLTSRPHNLSLSNKKIKRIFNINIKTTNRMLIDLKKSRNKNNNININILPYGKHHIDNEDIQSVVKVLKSPSLTQGKNIDEFENRISEFVGSKYAVAVSSCTAGLHLSSIISGLNNKNKFLTSPISFVSTSNAGVYLGSNPIFSDIDINTLNISYSEVKKIIKNNKINTILPVHFAGNPVDVKKLSNIVGSNTTIIEDAAHALGAKYKDGNMVGSCKHSHMCVFSFHPVKLIASGEGGIVTTNDKYIYKELLKLRSHGINKLDEKLINTKYAYDKKNKQNAWYYEMQKLGYHYRLTDIQSSLAISQLKKINKFLKKRFQLVKRYENIIKKFENCNPAQHVDFKYSANHLFVIKIDFDKLKISRNELINNLRELKIGTQVHYLPIFLQPFYKRYKFHPSNFPNSMEYYNSCLSLPLYYDLSITQQDYILEKLYELIG